jgi:DNA polymerase-4
VTLKIRTEGFHTFTRAQTLAERTNYADEIFQTVKILAEEFFKSGPKIRLIGVRVSHFIDPYLQESLFHPAATEKKEKVHQAIDRIKDKFGEDAIRRGIPTSFSRPPNEA